MSPGWSEAQRAAERTHLSWRRTVLSALLVMLVAVSKVVLTTPRPRAVLVLLLMALGWLGIAAIARRRMASLNGARRTYHSPAPLALLIVAFAALAAALIL